MLLHQRVDRVNLIQRDVDDDLLGLAEREVLVELQVILEVFDAAELLQEAVESIAVTIERSVERVHEGLFDATKLHVVGQVLHDFRKLKAREVSK